MSGRPGADLARAAEMLVRDYMAIRPDETVLVTADSATDMDAVEAVIEAAEAAHARTALLRVRQLPFQGALADPHVVPPLAAATGACDVWLDFTFPYLAGSHVHDLAMKAGRVRYLLVGDLGGGGLVRLFGRVDLDRYHAVHAGFDALVAAALGKEMRIANALGSDIAFTVGKPGYAKPRRGDRPGTFLVPGACTIFPEVETVRGVVHVEAAFHEWFAAFARPLALHVAGKVQRLEGGGADRRVLDRALRRAAGGDYGYVIHFTHGIHPAARMGGRSFIEDMRVVGNDAVGLGLPWWVPGGGENHPDAILTQQTIVLDGTTIVEDGTIVAPDGLARAAADLVPLAA